MYENFDYEDFKQWLKNNWKRTIPIAFGKALIITTIIVIISIIMAKII